jgi:DNA-binding XRE family transcriptional regulator
MTMARQWSKVRSDAVGTVLDEQGVARARKLMDEAVRASKLADVRKAQGGTQTAVAKVMNVSQARVSKIERGDLSHSELGTLQAYVAALGGKLHVIADFGDQKITVE